MPLLVPLLLVPLTEEPAERLALPAPAQLQPRLHHEQRPPREDAASPDAKLLRAMIADSSGTQADWAKATGVVKSNVNRRLMRLKGEGLVQRADGRWTVTPAGRRAV